MKKTRYGQRPSEPQFYDKASFMVYSQITGKLEPMIAWKKIAYAYAITSSSMILLVLVMISAFIGVMVYKVSMAYLFLHLDIPGIKDYNQLIASFTGAMISACIIQTLTMVFRRLALWLTNIEYHRTQSQFDQSFIYKNYALSFVNNYSSAFYVAFFKGKFFTHPGDIEQWDYFGGLRTDVCSPTGCIADLSINLMVILTTKIIGRMIMTILFPFVYTRVNAIIKHINNYNKLLVS
nr:unnamed protein product [Callosobruchus chinensis]